MISVNAEDLALVVQLALLTESRDEDEQSALLVLAEALRRAGPDLVTSVIRSWDQPE